MIIWIYAAHLWYFLEKEFEYFFCYVRTLLWAETQPLPFSFDLNMDGGIIVHDAMEAQYFLVNHATIEALGLHNEA